MQTPGFGTRFALAFSAFFKILFNGSYAAKVLTATDVGDTQQVAPPESDTAPHSVETLVEVPDTVPVPPISEVIPTAPMPDPRTEARKALQFLGALQREGRFIDFLMEDLNAAADADIGAAARVVHGGCKKVLDGYLTIEPVWPGDEGSRVTLDEGFDRNRVSLTGNVSGEPPFSGTLQHPGWYAESVRFPELSDSADPDVLMPAEIEL